MNLHEYQSKQLFAAQGIAVPVGHVVSTADDAVSKAESMLSQRWVIKAQVHAGGRGKAGGVVIVDDLKQLRAESERMLGSFLKTQQTGEPGLPIQQLLIEAPTQIDRELYLSVLVDRASCRVLFMVSPEGGMNIEEVAESTPEAIHTILVDSTAGLQPWQCRKLAFALFLSGTQIGEFQQLLFALYAVFTQADASLIEINPLVVTTEGHLMALDGKINLDDNALYRHPDLQAMRDMSQEDQREAAAVEHQLNYISLDGTIGCMVNGAGLAMATMDLVQLHGGRPANFLDVGGGATADRVSEAFKLILSDDKVAAVLVNIFGGIVRCDLIAQGIIQAVEQVGVSVPVVVRLEGTNAEQGLQILADSGLTIETASDLTQAAIQVVAAAKGDVA